MSLACRSGCEAGIHSGRDTSPSQNTMHMHTHTFTQSFAPRGNLAYTDIFLTNNFQKIFEWIFSNVWRDCIWPDVDWLPANSWMSITWLCSKSCFFGPLSCLPKINVQIWDWQATHRHTHACACAHMHTRPQNNWIRVFNLIMMVCNQIKKSQSLHQA